MMQALENVKKAGCNALAIYLGNFGPEISETLLAKHFDGPCMFIAAAEESKDNLVQGRGDAYCGMLNASYNLKLRNIRAYIPEEPVGTAEECAERIHEFLPIARAIIGLSELKIISFGPRPLNFLACNAPIKQLYNLGVEIEENSELGAGNKKPEHAGRRYCTGTDYLLPSTEYGRQHPACLYCTGRGASGRDAFLWFHRYFCHPGDESFLPPCSDREKLPASRSSGIWTFWKNAV